MDIDGALAEEGVLEGQQDAVFDGHLVAAVEIDDLRLALQFAEGVFHRQVLENQVVAVLGEDDPAAAGGADGPAGAAFRGGAGAAAALPALVVGIRKDGPVTAVAPDGQVVLVPDEEGFMVGPVRDGNGHGRRLAELAGIGHGALDGAEISRTVGIDLQFGRGCGLCLCLDGPCARHDAGMALDDTGVHRDGVLLPEVQHPAVELDFQPLLRQPERGIMDDPVAAAARHHVHRGRVQRLGGDLRLRNHLAVAADGHPGEVRQVDGIDLHPEPVIDPDAAGRPELRPRRHFQQQRCIDAHK